MALGIYGLDTATILTVRQIEHDELPCPRGFNVIKKGKAGYRVPSSKGKNLGGPYKTMEEAKKRLRQVEFFKRSK